MKDKNNVVANTNFNMNKMKSNGRSKGGCEVYMSEGDVGWWIKRCGERVTYV